ncbi:MAG: cytochrome c4 [Candidatus Azosocius agrarius]|nr:MAG: cytochrome c4 [Gammaproteobacteria bacterium]
MFKFFLLFICFLISTNSYAISENIELGKIKSGICSTCHGNDGNSVVAMWPKLAGQFSKYLIAQLEAFKHGEDGSRFDPIMYGIVKDLSFQDFLDISSYFSLQKISDNGVNLKEVNKLGKKIYLSGDLQKNIISCSSCHGVLGEGNEFANIPKLRHQHAYYISIQLQKYKSGIRKTDAVSVMRDISLKMTDDEILAVSEYISTL